MAGIRTQDGGNFDSGCGDQVVAELGEADNEVHCWCLQVGGDLYARVLPPEKVQKIDTYVFLATNISTL